MVSSFIVLKVTQFRPNANENSTDSFDFLHFLSLSLALQTLPCVILLNVKLQTTHQTLTLPLYLLEALIQSYFSTYTKARTLNLSYLKSVLDFLLVKNFIASLIACVTRVLGGFYLKD